MGDYFKQTFEKCVLGVADAVIHGRPVSPSTEENCAVAARELREAVEKEVASKPKEPKEPKEEKKTHFQARDVKRLHKLIPELKQRRNVILQEKSYDVLLEKNPSYDAKKFRETMEKLLKNLSPEDRKKLLEGSSSEFLLNKGALELLQKHPFLLDQHDK